MESLIGQLGVGGILAFLVIREVLSFLKTRNAGNPGNPGSTNVIMGMKHQELIDAVKSLNRSMDKMCGASEKQMGAIGELTTEIKIMRTELRPVIKRVTNVTPG